MNYLIYPLKKLNCLQDLLRLMNEELLKAIVKLFALASTIEDLNEKGRNMIRKRLSNDLNEVELKNYIQLFEDHLLKYHNKSSGSISEKNIHQVCAELNKELNASQKVFVLIRLLEYIFSDGSASEYENSFLKILILEFNISEDELNLSTTFVQAQHIEQLGDLPFLVLSDSDLELKNQQVKTIPFLIGDLVFMHVKSVNSYFFKTIKTEGLSLNRRPISNNQIYSFNHGSAIRGQNTRTIYYSDIQADFLEGNQTENILFEANEVNFTFPTGDMGLQPFSLSETNGRMIGIMGGSGAGKSTLLNVLNGNLTPSSGSVKINGIDIHYEKPQLKGVIGFISQDDLLIEELTVFENLFFSAKLCFDKFSDIEITKKVNDLLTSLGLFQAKDLKVGNPIDKVISGGQRKRLNIALELIREPAVLFVDEPTSGLSSRDSENIMDLMKELAIKGKLIFIVIHQPSSYIFKLFDRLVLLDTGGYMVYYGEPVDSVSYFKHAAKHLDADSSECLTCGNVNSEQIFDIIEQKVFDESGKITSIRKKESSQWYAHFKANGKPNRKPELKEEDLHPPVNHLDTPNPFKQFQIFLTRDLKSKAANKQYILINLLEAPVLAFFIAFFVRYSSWSRDGELAYIYWFNENIPAYIFMAVIVALFIGMTVSAEEIFRDRKLRQREKFLNLNKASYLFSKYALLIGISALQSLLFVIIGNQLLQIEDMLWRYWLIMFSTSFFANMVGLNISASFNSAVTIYILIPFMIIPQLIFSGVIVSFDRLNPTVSSRKVVPIIGEVMASRWSYEALMVSQYKDNPIGKILYPVDKKLSQVGYLKSYWLTELQSQVSFVKLSLHMEEDKSKVERFIRTIEHEITQFRPVAEFPAYKFKSELDISKIDSHRVQQIELYLEAYKKHLNQLYIEISKERDRVIYTIEKSNPEYSFTQLKGRYINESLGSLVRLDNRITKVIVMDGKLVQRGDPIYRDANGFRSHFYAANKKLFGKSVDTFWYNTGILWLMSLSLMITLYFDIFKKLVNLKWLRRNKAHA